jgi:diguanylate cyclase (GGDEF)-like protein/PAS domain S-box-containing protein
VTEDEVALLLAGLDADDGCTIVLDRDRRVVYMNAAAEAMSTVTLEQGRGRTVAEVAEDGHAHLGRRGDVYRLLDLVIGEVMTSGMPHIDDDATRLSPDGDDVTSVSLRLLPIERDGAVIGALFVARDHAPGGSLMFRQAAVAMSHVDRTGMVREANLALTRLVGRSELDLMATPFVDLLHPDDAPLVAPILDSILQREAVEGRLEVRVVQHDGTVRWIDLSIAQNGMGRPGSGGACAILQDVTERVQLQTELEAARARLLDLALHDPLTGLPNRTRLADEMTAAQHRAAVTGTHVAVLFIDLDGFKRVNDTAGHDAGDRLLVEVGGRLRHLLRPDDVAARIGGDEFVLCCSELSTDPEVAQGQAARIADRVRASLSLPFVVDDTRWTLSASVGIALSRAGDDDPAALLRTADAEMYRLKTAR